MILTEELISKIKSNIFARSLNAIDDFKTFDWHIDTHQLNSSQALAIDFWGCIKTSLYKDEIINLMFDKSESDWEIVLEYEDKTLLSEKRKSTQIDVVLKTNDTAIFIESKFTEKVGGSCSQTRKTKSGLKQCSGNYEPQTNPINGIEANCALSAKGVLYWDYIDKLTTFTKDGIYTPCPIAKGEYQWMRNVTFAQAYSERYNVQTETYLAYLDSPKSPIAKKINKDTYLGRLKGNFLDSKAFVPVEYYSSLDLIIKHFDTTHKVGEMKVFIDLKEWNQNKESCCDN